MTQYKNLVFRTALLSLGGGNGYKDFEHELANSLVSDNKHALLTNMLEIH